MGLEHKTGHGSIQLHVLSLPARNNAVSWVTIELARHNAPASDSKGSGAGKGQVISEIGTWFLFISSVGNEDPNPIASTCCCATLQLHAHLPRLCESRQKCLSLLDLLR